MALKWISNTVNPENLDLAHVFLAAGQSLKDALMDDIDFLSDKTIGCPKATDKYSVEELEAMGMVGVYEEQ